MLLLIDVVEACKKIHTDGARRERLASARTKVNAALCHVLMLPSFSAAPDDVVRSHSVSAALPHHRPLLLPPSAITPPRQ